VVAVSRDFDFASSGNADLGNEVNWRPTVLCM
jgi:hypothetical protein